MVGEVSSFFREIFLVNGMLYFSEVLQHRLSLQIF